MRCLPKVGITYSDIYDIVLSKSKKIKYNPKMRIKGEKFARKLQKVWNKHERRILSYLSKLTNLKWLRNYIECTVSFTTPYPFSCPLTLYIHRSTKYEITTITHELCHILLWNNRNKVKWPESNSGIYKKYKNESYLTKLHLPVHAIVILTMKKIFGKNAGKYLVWEQWWNIWKNNPMGKEYRRSWEIVEREGPVKIIRDIIKVIK